MDKEPIWHSLKIEKIYQKLKTSKEGLTESEAKKRLLKYGPNIFEQTKTRSGLSIFLVQFANFLVVLLIFAFLLSIFTQPPSHTIILLVIIALNVLMGFFLEHKAETALASLRKIFTHKAYARRDGEEFVVSAHDLVPGDIVLVKSGNRIPADLRIISDNILHVDESALTGESVPAHKFDKILPPHTNMIDRANMVYCGSMVTSGQGEGVVVATGADTELGEIAKGVQRIYKKTPLQTRLNYLGKILGLVSIILVLIIMIIGVLRGMGYLELFNYAIALLVAVVPESLPTITTLSLAIGVIAMAKNKAIIKKLSAVETLATVNVICSDKTGTLTKNELTCKLIWTPASEVNIKGIGYAPKPHFELNNEIKPIIDTAVFCNDAQLTFNEQKDRWGIIGDPTEGALLVLGEKAGVKFDQKPGKEIHRIPFDEERLRMSVVYKVGGKAAVFTKGAPRSILNVSKLDTTQQSKIEEKVEQLSGQGFRVLAFAQKSINSLDLPGDSEIEKDMQFQGLVAMIDPPDEQVRSAIASCMQAHIRPIMITGDHRLTALSVAQQIGLKVTDKNLMKGEDLENLSIDELAAKIKNITIFARTTPKQKTKILKALKKCGLMVAMTGDGINDALALKQADIGIAMGKRGQDVAKEAADIVLLDDRFITIIKAIEYARTIYDNIKKFLTLLLIGNFKEIFLVTIAFIVGLPLPFTALQILWINLITDSFPALALAFERPSPDIMKQKPKAAKSEIIGEIIQFAFTVGALASLLGLYLFIFYLPDHIKAQTVVFTYVVFFELVIVFSIRSPKPFWQGAGIFSNKLLVLGVLFSAFLQLIAIYTPLSKPMQTTSLGAIDWIIIIGFCLFSFMVLEFVKLFRKTA